MRRDEARAQGLHLAPRVLVVDPSVKVTAADEGARISGWRRSGRFAPALGEVLLRPWRLQLASGPRAKSEILEGAACVIAKSSDCGRH